MSRKIIAIVGSYRKGGIIDSAVDAILAAAAEKGAETDTIYLIDRHIEFCTNCRKCTQAEGLQRGKCVQNDDLGMLLDKIERADALIIGSPVNFYNVTAVTRRFIERLIGYAYWPWGKGGPAMRSKERKKKAVLVTSSAMPAPMGRVFTGALRILKITAQTLGAKPVGTLFIGLSALGEKQALPERVIRKTRALGHALAKPER